MLNLKGKVAIVTGSGRGIGRDIAKMLKEFEAEVVVSDVDSSLAKDTAENLGRILGVTVDEVRRDLTAGIPLGKLGSTRDVAAAVAYLASELGDFYCGQIVAPNGGEVMM